MSQSGSDGGRDEGQGGSDEEERIKENLTALQGRPAPPLPTTQIPFFN